MLKIAIATTALLTIASPVLAATTSGAPSFKLTVPISVSNIDKAYGYAGVECRLSATENPSLANLPGLFNAAVANKLTPAVVPISAGAATFTFGLPASPVIHSAICQLLGFSTAPNGRPKQLSDFPLASLTEYVSVKVPTPAATSTPAPAYDIRKNSSS